MSVGTLTAEIIELELASRQRGELDLEKLPARDAAYIKARVPILLELVDTTDPVALWFFLETMRLVDLEMVAKNGAKKS